MNRMRAELIWDFLFRLAIWSLILCILALFQFPSWQWWLPFVAFIPTHPDHSTYVMLVLFNNLLSLIIVLSVILGGTSFIVRKVLRDMIADENFLQGPEE